MALHAMRLESFIVSIQKSQRRDGTANEGDTNKKKKKMNKKEICASKHQNHNAHNIVCFTHSLNAEHILIIIICIDWKKIVCKLISSHSIWYLITNCFKIYWILRCKKFEVINVIWDLQFRNIKKYPLVHCLNKYNIHIYSYMYLYTNTYRKKIFNNKLFAWFSFFFWLHCCQRFFLYSVVVVFVII